MAVIGSFVPTRDGGWIGSIQTLSMHAKVRLVPNDNRENENAPSFRVFVGQSRIGDAWEARSAANPPRDYLKLRLDDPAWPEPISAALFPGEEGADAQLVWNRRQGGKEAEPPLSNCRR